MPTPIENNTTALQALKVKAEGLPDRVIDYSGDLKGIVERTSTEIKLPEGVTKIGSFVFSGYTSLVLIKLPNGITSIEGSAFQGCTNLALTSLPDGLTSIGYYAFQYCTNLALTSLPNGITSIGTSVFYGCTNLALTSLPEGISSIGQSAFYGCTNLKKIWIPKGCMKITASSAAYSTFYNCTNLTDIYTDATEKLSGWDTYWNYTGDSTQATVHYNVTKAEFEAMFTEYTITYESVWDEEFLATAPTSYRGIDLPIEIGEPTDAGYKFMGWTSQFGTSIRGLTIPVGTTGNITLKATWSGETS